MCLEVDAKKTTKYPKLLLGRVRVGIQDLASDWEIVFWQARVVTQSPAYVWEPFVGGVRGDTFRKCLRFVFGRMQVDTKRL